MIKSGDLFTIMTPFLMPALCRWQGQTFPSVSLNQFLRASLKRFVGSLGQNDDNADILAVEKPRRHGLLEEVQSLLVVNLVARLIQMLSLRILVSNFYINRLFRSEILNSPGTARRHIHFKENSQ